MTRSYIKITKHQAERQEAELQVHSEKEYFTSFLGVVGWCDGPG